MITDDLKPPFEQLDIKSSSAFSELGEVWAWGGLFVLVIEHSL